MAKKFRRAVVMAPYGVFEACWTADSDGVYLKIEDGRTRQLSFDLWEKDYGA